MTQQDVFFYSGEEKLAATLHLPEGHDPCPAIVLCNGFGGVKDLVLPAIAEYFVDGGLAALRFDHRGFGASTGTKWRLLPLEQVEDIHSALTWLASHPRVASERLGLYGTSFGGANAIVAAAFDPRVRVVATCVCRQWKSLDAISAAQLGVDRISGKGGTSAVASCGHR